MTMQDAILDPEMGLTAFTVERITYIRSPEGTSERKETFSALGAIHPGTPEMLRLLPEEERREEFIAVYTVFPLSLGKDAGKRFTGPDRIRWAEQAWRVVRVRDWSAFGYCQALAVLLQEETP